jgi:CubicO group peptidase (beta-lactamase class C family)
MVKYQHTMLKYHHIAMLCVGALSLVPLVGPMPLVSSVPLARPVPPPAAVLAFVDSAATATLRSGPVAGMTVVVARGGHVLVEKAYGFSDLENGVPASPRTVYEIASVTKQFTAAGIMRLVEAGRLGLDDDVAPYFPRFPFGGRRVTVRQLLTHTSGVHNYVELPDRDGFLRLPLSNDSLLGLVASTPFDFDPGTQMHYSNTGYLMLGMIIEHLTGMSYGQFLQQTFLTPLGMRDTRSCDNRVLIPHRARGYHADSGVLINAQTFDMTHLSPAGGLCSTARDLFTWSRALYRGRAVTADSYRLMTTETPLPGRQRSFYGFGLDVWSMAGHRWVWHDGGMPGFRSRVVTFPDDSVIVIVLANTMSETSYPTVTLENAIDRFALGLPDVQRMLQAVATTGGGDAVTRTYHGLRQRYPAVDFEPGQLNSTGYVLMRAGKVADAITVFRLNVEMFPEDWNAYDSLGEGYMAHGDTALAVTNYQHSLTLNPDNTNGKQMLAKLRGEGR